MIIFTYIASILSSLIIGAHFLREANYGLALLSVLLPFTFLIRKKFVVYIYSILLFSGLFFLIETTINIYQFRLSIHQDYLRMIIIMSTVSIFILLTSMLLLRDKFLDRYN